MNASLCWLIWKWKSIFLIACINLLIVDLQPATNIPALVVGATKTALSVIDCFANQLWYCERYSWTYTLSFWGLVGLGLLRLLAVTAHQVSDVRSVHDSIMIANSRFSSGVMLNLWMKLCCKRSWGVCWCRRNFESKILLNKPIPSQLADLLSFTALFFTFTCCCNCTIVWPM